MITRPARPAKVFDEREYPPRPVPHPYVAMIAKHKTEREVAIEELAEVLGIAPDQVLPSSVNLSD